jgi:dsDNA-specific endonuclease/ATPase MutS2
MKTYDIFLEMLPKIDLHGYDIESARVRTNDFIEEAVALKYPKVVIIHGIGEGKVKHSVHNTLSKNKHVSSYHVDNINIGCTIVEIKQ